MNKNNLVPITTQSAQKPARLNPFGMLQHDISRVFEDFWSEFSKAHPSEFMPSMDLIETPKEIEMTVEVPGLEEKDVQIELAGNTLTVRGEKKAEKEEKDKNYRLLERSYGSFFRSIDLPAGTDASKIKATVSKGVLNVKIEKPVAADVKKIEIKAA
jgi:HSP20 family protein